MRRTIAISSGKGGTGKTFVATNIAAVLAQEGLQIDTCAKILQKGRLTYLDCDVEEPNGHLFLKPVISGKEDVLLTSPAGIDDSLCTKCGRCVEVCNYNAITKINDTMLFFNNLCHACDACKIVCPVNAIIEKEKKIGTLVHGESGLIDVHYALLETAEGGMSPRLIRRVKEYTAEGINILDSPPGTACPVVETLKDADLCVLVTDPTPFGINDLRLAVEMCRELDREPVVLVNRAEYRNDELKIYCRGEGLEIIGEIPDDRRIAETYSTGALVVDRIPEYRDLFARLARDMCAAAGEKRTARKKPAKAVPSASIAHTSVDADIHGGERPAEVVVISGKGGTGKTSIVAGFTALSNKIIISDCDVDAADLHLILQPEVKESGLFSGSYLASIDQDRCTGCGRCYDACRFDAIDTVEDNGKLKYTINPTSCEGCGVCGLVCRDNAVHLTEAVNGEWFVSDTRFGPMSHAKLGIAEENSGKLVTLVRNKKDRFAGERQISLSVIDGSPGTGCPVISSITGADYAVVVTEPTVSGVHDLERILEVTGFFRVRTGIIVNKYDLNEEMTDRIGEIALERGCELLGRIPYDTAFIDAQIQGLSIVEYSNGPVMDSLKEIWETVTSQVLQARPIPAKKREQ